MRLQGHYPGVDLRRLEQTLHDSVQLAGLCLKSLEWHSPQIWRRAKRSVVHHRQVSGQHGDRRSELMRGHVEKRALRLAGGVGGRIESRYLLLTLPRRDERGKHKRRESHADVEDLQGDHLL